MAPPWRVESEKRFRLISVIAICDLEWQNIVSIQKTHLFLAYGFEWLESDFQKVWSSQNKSMRQKRFSDRFRSQIFYFLLKLAIQIIFFS